MGWWLVVVPLGPGDDVEVLANRLWSLGTTGVAEADHDGTPTLTAGFADRAAAEAARAALGHPAATAEPVDPDGWVTEWRHTAQPTRVGDLVVRAPWHPPVGTTSREIVIDPGPAFGHGGHPTTRLILGELARVVTPGASVLDVGCGSGVLAVAAAVLGAGRVVAVDTDPDAVAATRANAATNHVAVEVRRGTVTADLGPFDVVVANLLAPVLRQLAPDLVAATAAGGRLVVAGLLVDQRAEVEAALRPLATVRAGRDGDWALLVLAHPARGIGRGSLG